MLPRPFMLADRGVQVLGSTVHAHNSKGHECRNDVRLRKGLADKSSWAERLPTCFTASPAVPRLPQEDWRAQAEEMQRQLSALQEELQAAKDEVVLTKVSTEEVAFRVWMHHDW